MTAGIPGRERDAVIQALRAGVVPRLGIRHIQVGRAREVEETVRDVARIVDGGSAVRFVIGDYGAGKCVSAWKRGSDAVLVTVIAPPR